MIEAREAVLDASALMAFLHGEPGAGVVRPRLAHAVISSINLSEVMQKGLTRGGRTRGLLDTLKAHGVVISPFAAEDVEETALLWPFTAPLGLSLADRACLALAIRLGLPVMTADRVWARLRLDVAIEVIR